jgi:xanthine/uracil/vitamin C permease (AzgA family)
MNVKVKFAALKQTKRHEYVVRFVFGGLVTVATGIIAKKFGPGIGGLFLAFPAIFPASATLVENRETEKKQRVGMEGTIRGRNAASPEARGAAMGSVGLIVFAIIVWQFLPGHLAWLVLAVATLAWLIVSVALWKLRKTIHGYQTQRHQRSGDQPDVR